MRLRRAEPVTDEELATEEAPMPPSSRRRLVLRRPPPRRLPRAKGEGYRSLIAGGVAAVLLAVGAATDIPLDRIQAVAPWLVAVLGLSLGGKDIPKLAEMVVTVARALRERG